MVWNEGGLEHRALAVHQQKEYLTLIWITHLSRKKILHCKVQKSGHHCRGLLHDFKIMPQQIYIYIYATGKSLAWQSIEFLFRKQDKGKDKRELSTSAFVLHEQLPGLPHRQSYAFQRKTAIAPGILALSADHSLARSDKKLSLKF